MVEPQLGRVVEVLLVAENPAEIRHTEKTLQEAAVCNRVHVAHSGEEAIEFVLRMGAWADAPRPGLIVLDWSLPKQGCRRLMAELEADAGLSTVPLAVLTSSHADQELWRVYGLRAASYIRKPMDLEQFLRVVREMDALGLTIVLRPE